MPAWLDAHCHLSDPRWGGELQAVLARARAAGVVGFLQGGVEPDEWCRQLDLDSSAFRCFGVHPWYAAKVSRAMLDQALAALEDFLPQALALGELGLDRFIAHDEAAWRNQCHAFETQLALAEKWRLPVVLHVVRAHGQVLARLKERPLLAGGMVHGFNGAIEVARAYAALGLGVSVGAAASKPNARRLRQAIALIPAEALVVESDAPEPGPPAWAGVLGEPAALPLIATAIAELRGESVATLLARSTANLTRIFGIRSPL